MLNEIPRLVIGLEQTCSLLSGTAIKTALFWLCILLSWPFRSYLWAHDVPVLSGPTVSNEKRFPTVQDKLLTVKKYHSFWDKFFYQLLKIMNISFLLTWYHGCFTESSFPIVRLLPLSNKQTNNGVMCEPVAKNPVNWWGDLFEQSRSLTSKFFDLIFYVYLRNDEPNDFRFYLYYVAI